MGTHSDGQSVSVYGFAGPYFDKREPVNTNAARIAELKRRVEDGEAAHRELMRLQINGLMSWDVV